jgi:pyruvate,water dikinase
MVPQPAGPERLESHAASATRLLNRGGTRRLVARAVRGELVTERPVAVAGIEWLGAAAGDVRLVGGKAASLDRLARLGFTIPPGFCITTDAFHAQLAGIPGAAADLAALPDEAARGRLTRSFTDSALARELRERLDDALSRLVAEPSLAASPDPRLAVRSSGIGEDGSSASYAGLHETELGVRPGDVEAAVRRCWASLWSGPALAYRVRHGLAPDGGGMAVVVQALVPADASAVVFTRHPVTGTDDLVMTASRGLGDRMVAGEVTPDTITLDRATLEVIDYAPGDGGAGGALDGDALADLADLAMAVERGFGAPVDIEAATAAGTWYLLQARPITT